MLMIVLVEVLLFLAIFYKLVTTNHWTIGKKLLVLLVAGIVVEGAGLIVAIHYALPILAMALVKLPKMLVSLIMVYFFYRNESVLG